MARHDPARHDDVRPRHAARRRHARARSSGPRPTSTSSSSRRRSSPPARRSWRGRSRRRTRSTPPTIRRRVGQHMTNTDSAPFRIIVPSISLRENERGAQIGAGWDPHWHQPTDVFTTYTRQGFPPRPERRADDARRDRHADRCAAGEVSSVIPQPRQRLSGSAVLFACLALRGAWNGRRTFQVSRLR